MLKIFSKNYFQKKKKKKHFTHSLLWFISSRKLAKMIVKTWERLKLAETGRQERPHLPIEID